MFTVLSVRNRAECKDLSLEEMCVIIGVQVCMREEGDQVQKEKSYLGRGETFASMVGWISPDLSHLPCGPESVQIPPNYLLSRTMHWSLPLSLVLAMLWCQRR